MFFRKKKVEHHAKKIDKFITTLIIWWAVASMVGLSKTKKWQKIGDKAQKVAVKTAKTGYAIFWKALVWAIGLLNKKKK